MSKLVT
ncbi:hypothetical protein VCHENC02_5240, partial [Vibrio harveyi]